MARLSGVWRLAVFLVVTGAGTSCNTGQEPEFSSRTQALVSCSGMNGNNESCYWTCADGYECGSECYVCVAQDGGTPGGGDTAECPPASTASAECNSLCDADNYYPHCDCTAVKKQNAKIEFWCGPSLNWPSLYEHSPTKVLLYQGYECTSSIGGTYPTKVDVTLVSSCLNKNHGRSPGPPLTKKATSESGWSAPNGAAKDHYDAACGCHCVGEFGLQPYEHVCHDDARKQELAFSTRHCEVLYENDPPYCHDWSTPKCSPWCSEIPACQGSSADGGSSPDGGIP